MGEEFFLREKFFSRKKLFSPKIWGEEIYSRKFENNFLFEFLERKISFTFREKKKCFELSRKIFSSHFQLKFVFQFCENIFLFTKNSFPIKIGYLFLWNKKYYSIFRTKFFLHIIRKEIFLHNLKRNLSSHFSKRIFSSHFREKNFLPQFRNLFFFHEKKFVENNFCFEKFFSKQKLFSQWEKKISFEFLETKKSLTCPVGGGWFPKIK